MRLRIKRPMWAAWALTCALLAPALSLAPMHADAATPRSKADAAEAAAKVAPGLFAQPEGPLPLPPEIAARAFVLQDVSSRQTLAARNADVPAEPASMTKLMTAYLVLQALRDGQLKLDQALPVSDRAVQTGLLGGSRSFFVAQGTATVNDLLQGLIVHSANDAAVALAEGLAGSVDAFVARMNRQAQVFGLPTTHFVNPEGLSARGHVSTARELSVIATRLVLDFPAALSRYATQSATLNGVKQSSRNLLLFRDPSVDGLQVGYTESAGYGLVATSHRPSGSAPGAPQRRLISVVLGASSPESRSNESQKLLNWGYSAFDLVTLFAANEAVSTARVWKGSQASVRLGRPDAPIAVSVPKGLAGRLQTSLTRNDPLFAPLATGQSVATLHVMLGTQVWQNLPLQALDTVPSAGWLGRTWDAIRLGIQ
jgi:D-alanyl-D-alanine carboxypeptidase (penicillin-binding protein 5/6)